MMAVTDARIRFCQVAARRGHRLKGGLCPCCTSLITVGQGCDFARAAVRSCGSLRKRRELAICLTFVPLNAELVACRRSRSRLSVKGFLERWPSLQHANRRRNGANNRNRADGMPTITTATMSSPLCSIGPRRSFEHRPRYVGFNSQ